MRIELDLELKDTPGQLVRALEPISRLGGNIISIVHIREETSKERRLPVKVIIDVEDDALERIISELESRDIWVAKVGEARKKERITVMLIGHVVDTDLRDTIDRLNEIKDVMVADMTLSMPHPDHETSALMDIEVGSADKIRKTLKTLEEMAEEKQLTLIKSIGE